MRWNFRDFVRFSFVKFNFGTLTTFYYYRTCYILITWNDAVRIVWTLRTPEGMSKYSVSEMKYEWVICNNANKHGEFKFIPDWKICQCSPSVFLNRLNATWKLVTLLLMWHLILHALSIRDVRDIYIFSIHFFFLDLFQWSKCIFCSEVFSNICNIKRIKTHTGTCECSVNKTFTSLRGFYLYELQWSFQDHVYYSVRIISDSW